MDLNALIDEVCARVQAKIAASDQDRILILNSETQDYQCDPADYQIVVAYNFTISALGKISAGILDDSYTRMFAEAVLAGKKVLLVAEEIELYRYQNQQSPYYKALLGQLEILLGSGVKVVSQDQLKTAILTGPDGGEAVGTAKETDGSAPQTEKKIVKLEKKVVTERDVITACHERAEVILVREKAILTALAREYAQKRNVEIRTTADGDCERSRAL